MAIIRKGDEKAEKSLERKASRQNISKPRSESAEKKSGVAGARKVVSSSVVGQDARKLKNGAIGPVSGAALAKRRGDSSKQKQTNSVINKGK